MVDEKEPSPLRLVPDDYVPVGSTRYKVQDGDQLKSIAEGVGITWQELAEYNWWTDRPPEINWYLHNRVGCTATTPDGRNYALRSADDPGIIHLPPAQPNRFAASRRGDRSGHTTVRRLRPPPLVLRIPLGYQREFSMARSSIGKIYVPTRWGGELTVKTSVGQAQLHYKDGKDIDLPTIDAVRKGQHAVAGPAAEVRYDVPKDKHGWYFICIHKATRANVETLFVQEGCARSRPWNGWYCPTAPGTHPNLYEPDESRSFAPLLKYDAKFGTATRAWEAANHVGRLPWEGHCWGWSLASIAKKDPKDGAAPFTKWEIRALYSELADKATHGWRWVIGDPKKNPIPAGPVTEAENEGPDAWVKTLHDGLRDYIREQKRALNANLRGVQLTASWAANPIPGLTPLTANAESKLRAEVKWRAADRTVQFHDGPQYDLAGDGDFELSSTVGSLELRVETALLPPDDRTGTISLMDEVWNYAVFRYLAGFSQADYGGDEKYVEIDMHIYGNLDSPFPPDQEGEPDQEVERHYTYRLTYDGRGDTTEAGQNLINCNGALPPKCFGIVEDEDAFGWHSKNPGITKDNVFGL